MFIIAADEGNKLALIVATLISGSLGRYRIQFGSSGSNWEHLASAGAQVAQMYLIGVGVLTVIGIVQVDLRFSLPEWLENLLLKELLRARCNQISVQSSILFAGHRELVEQISEPTPR